MRSNLLDRVRRRLRTAHRRPIPRRRWRKTIVGCSRTEQDFPVVVNLFGFEVSNRHDNRREWRVGLCEATGTARGVKMLKDAETKIKEFRIV